MTTTGTIPVRPIISYQPNTEGIWDLSYTGYATAPGVRQSTLADMSQSAAHCRWNLDHPKDCTTALNFGRLLHLAIFQPELFSDGISHWVKPEGMKFSTKEGKAWRDERCQGRFSEDDILTAKEAGTICGMGKAIREHETAGPLIECEGVNEVSAFCLGEDFHAYTQLRKCRPDRLAIDSSGRIWVVDLKSICDDARPESFARCAGNFGYHRQTAFYLDALRDLGLEIAGFLHIASEKTPPYGVEVHKLCDEDIESGRRLYRGELERYAECAALEKWPAYSPGIKTVKLPRWATEPEAIQI